jgi:cytochrome c
MFIKRTLVALLTLPNLALADLSFEPLGQPAELAANQEQWQLTILPSGEGLPKGSGNAAMGKTLFESKCAGCHGFDAIGASAMPLVGEIGSLTSEYPEKTVNSYWPYATTLFDYIRRAMPPEAPFSLSADDVYSLSAYLLNQDGIINDTTVLNEETLPQVTMPNKDGFITVYPE